MFRKLNIRLWLGVIALLFCFTLAPLVAKAEGTGTLEIRFWYSGDIYQEEGDSFSLTFQSESGNSRTIIASVSATESLSMEIGAGLYTVTGLSYLGSNEMIKEQGYGVERSVSVPEGNTGIFHLYIGESQVAALDADYGIRAFIMDEEHDQDGRRIVFHDDYGTYTYGTNADGDRVISYNKETASDADTVDSSGEVPSSVDEYLSGAVPTQDPASQGEVVVEYYGEADQEGGGTNTDSVFAIVVVLGTIVGCALFFLRKRT